MCSLTAKDIELCECFHVPACVLTFFLETFDDETIVKLFRQCLPLLKMQMSVINPAFAHLFWCGVGCGGVTAPCFIKPIYHSRLPNQWDAEESSVSTTARRENTSSRCEAGGRREEHRSRSRSKYLSHILNAW